MTVAQKLWLVGRLETQALYGTKVTVTGHDGTEWTKVAIPSQPTNRDPRGYPGWVPTRQLTATAPASMPASRSSGHAPRGCGAAGPAPPSPART